MAQDAPGADNTNPRWPSPFEDDPFRTDAVAGFLVQKALLCVEADPSGHVVEVFFNRPVDRKTAGDTEHYLANGRLKPSAVRAPESVNRVFLVFPEQLLPGQTTLAISGVCDSNGEALISAPALPLSPAETVPPRVVSVEARAEAGPNADTVTIIFSEALRAEDAADYRNYELESCPNRRIPLTPGCAAYDGKRRVILSLRTPQSTIDRIIGSAQAQSPPTLQSQLADLSRGADFILRISNIRDLSGNAIAHRNESRGIVEGPSCGPVAISFDLYKNTRADKKGSGTGAEGRMALLRFNRAIVPPSAESAKSIEVEGAQIINHRPMSDLSSIWITFDRRLDPAVLPGQRLVAVSLIFLVMVALCGLGRAFPRRGIPDALRILAMIALLPAAFWTLEHWRKGPAAIARNIQDIAGNTTSCTNSPPLQTPPEEPPTVLGASFVGRTITVRFSRKLDPDDAVTGGHYALETGETLEKGRQIILLKDADFAYNPLAATVTIELPRKDNAPDLFTPGHKFLLIVSKVSDIYGMEIRPDSRMEGTIRAPEGPRPPDATDIEWAALLPVRGQAGFSTAPPPEARNCPDSSGQDIRERLAGRADALRMELSELPVSSPLTQRALKHLRQCGREMTKAEGQTHAEASQRAALRKAGFWLGRAEAWANTSRGAAENGFIPFATLSALGIAALLIVALERRHVALLPALPVVGFLLSIPLTASGGHTHLSLGVAAVSSCLLGWGLCWLVWRESAVPFSRQGARAGRLPVGLFAFLAITSAFMNPKQPRQERGAFDFVPAGSDPAWYQGLMARWQFSRENDALPDALAAERSDSPQPLVRTFLDSQSAAADGGKIAFALTLSDSLSLPVGRVIGMDGAAGNRLNLDQYLLSRGSRWFLEGENNAILLPSGMIRRLGLQPEDMIGRECGLVGKRFVVVGVFDGRLLSEFTDPDGNAPHFVPGMALPAPEEVVIVPRVMLSDLGAYAYAWMDPTRTPPRGADDAAQILASAGYELYLSSGTKTDRMIITEPESQARAYPWIAMLALLAGLAAVSLSSAVRNIEDARKAAVTNLHAVCCGAGATVIIVWIYIIGVNYFGIPWRNFDPDPVFGFIAASSCIIASALTPYLNLLATSCFKRAR